MAVINDPNEMKLRQDSDWRQFGKYAGDLEAGGAVSQKLNMDDITSGFSAFTLQMMGLTPGDLREIGIQVAYNDPESVGLAEFRDAGAEESAWEDSQKRDKAHFESSQDQQQQFLANQKFDQEQFRLKQQQEQDMLEERRLAEEKWLEEHKGVDPNQDLKNTVGIFTGIFGLYAVTQMAGGIGAMASQPTLVASSDHGAPGNGSLMQGVLDAAGNTISGGENIQHMVVNGPNSTLAMGTSPSANPVPGAAPAATGPQNTFGLSTQPTLTPGGMTG